MSAPKPLNGRLNRKPLALNRRTLAPHGKLPALNAWRSAFAHWGSTRTMFPEFAIERPDENFCSLDAGRQAEIRGFPDSALLHPGYELQLVRAKYCIYSTMRSW